MKLPKNCAIIIDTRQSARHVPARERIEIDMAKEKKQVERITDMETDFAKWYTDVCTKAELIDYTSTKGMFILRPYGYAIWENIQKELDARF